jgi:hypothetical protein
LRGWGTFGDLVWDLENEGMAFDEGVIGEWLRFADSESHEGQRDPVVQFLDNTCVPKMTSFTTM